MHSGTQVGGVERNQTECGATSANVSTGKFGTEPPANLLTAGMLEQSTRVGWIGRRASPLLSNAEPSKSAVEATVAPYVDANFYQIDAVTSDQISFDPVRHYCRKGWRQGRDPSPDFSTVYYLTEYPDVAERGINPLWHYISIGRAEGRKPSPRLNASDKGSAWRDYFDAAFYLATNFDVEQASVDPLDHYVSYGSKEGRAANAWFDEDYYLQTDQTLNSSGLPALEHYSLIGRDQGRTTFDSRERYLSILEGFRTKLAVNRKIASQRSISLPRIDHVVRLLLPLGQANRFVLSISHDAYTKAVGGTQLLISDEQTRFCTEGAAYLHLAPVLPRQRLIEGEGTNPLRATLNGVDIGLLDATTLAQAFRLLHADLPQERILICHCLLGHKPTDLVSLHEGFEPQRAFFWLHDYSSLCEGYTLIRNDLEYCGAPPPESLGCRICVHGKSRDRHLTTIRSLFEAVPFEILAPSFAALRVWTSAIHLPHRSKTVAPHATINFVRQRHQMVDLSICGKNKTPLRVAFVGHPAEHKGWRSFCRIVEASAHDPSYSFYHFGVETAATSLPIQFVEACATALNREAMREAIEEQAIDLVLVLSPWPETFSFVTHEAIAAGADILALEQSGNIADEVLRCGRGVVFCNIEAVLDFFTSGRANEYVRLSLDQGNEAGDLLHGGGSARVISEDQKITKLSA